jgi:hypothetical protein
MAPAHDARPAHQKSPILVCSAHIAVINARPNSLYGSLDNVRTIPGALILTIPLYFTALYITLTCSLEFGARFTNLEAEMMEAGILSDRIDGNWSSSDSYEMIK